MNGDKMEALRRQGLVEDYVKKYPPKPSVLKKNIVAQVAQAYLAGYQQCCLDLLTPKETPGMPATAVTLLNRVGEMVLKSRAELLSVPLPRLQCAGCFCMLDKQEDQDKGWCPNCEPHKGELMAQVAHLLQQTGKDNTVGTGG